jgi:hypothetical protein
MVPVGVLAADWQDLFDLKFSRWGVDMHIGLVFVAIVVGLIILIAVVRHRSADWEVTSADFNFAGCATVTVCPTDDIAGLAHQAWVEITTRRAVLPFDDENDVVVEIYNSWYELFRALRDLAKNVPVRKGLRKNTDAAKLVEALTGALNVGLRPHLTKWQARFRRWYEVEQGRAENAELSPQEVQRLFPEYEEMIADLKQVNQGLLTFAEALRKIAHERERSHWWQRRHRGTEKVL